MPLIVSVSGIRGLTGTDLTPDVARRFAAAYGSGLSGGRVAVGRDSRPSGAWLRDAVLAGLNDVGCLPFDVDILPTPSFGYYIRANRLAGGVQITASHNPAPYNGLKLFASDGGVLAPDDGATVESRFRSGYFPTSPDTLTQRTERDAWRPHEQRVLELADVPAIRDRGLTVVVDGNGGAGGPLACHLLQSLGVAVVPVACEPDGVFRHDPEPTPDHLRDIERLVRERPGAIGAALDPDADRLVLIDESGNCLSEELTLALAVRERLTHDRGPVVINLSTSQATEEIAKAAGVACHRSAVGEANVVAAMRRTGALVGGEGNGGVIDPRVGWVRDPFIGLALILGAMARSGQTLSRLAGELPQFTIRKEKYSLAPAALEGAFRALTRRWPDAVADRTDGLRLTWPDRWVHVRASNTEPIVRVIAEGRTSEVADQLCREAGSAIHSAQSQYSGKPS
jgi:phosphomannomutase